MLVPESIKLHRIISILPSRVYVTMALCSDNRPALSKEGSMTTVACCATNVDRSILHLLTGKRILHDRRGAPSSLFPFPVLWGFDIPMRHRANGGSRRSTRHRARRLDGASFTSWRNDRIRLRVPNLPMSRYAITAKMSAAAQSFL